MPRLSSETAAEIGVVVPIAAYGGAEKVAYAMARYLRALVGARVHLFVLGRPVAKRLGEFDEAFDTINFLADPAYPSWGGPLIVFGQECFAPDSDEVAGAALGGLLAGLDLVVNCHSAPLNAVMGSLRRQQRMRTATYLHVFDASPLGRPVGHPYLALAFEHAYDLVLTCSRQLAEQVHALGVPMGKIMPIANAAGFTISEALRAQQWVRRAQPRGARKLAVLYIGRLDRQKGVERLLGAARRFRSRALPIELRVIGSGLLETAAEGWAAKLAALGVTVAPPVYTSAALAEAYAWADVLLLPSRWEGAPLVIAECHLLGCIPVATRVGAVEELLEDGVDGMLVESLDDETTASSMAARVEMLLQDDALRRRMAAAGLHRAASNTWSVNFAPLGAWVARAIGKIRDPME